MDFIEINIKEYEGEIPSGYDLVVAEANDIEDTALVLYGFDEVGIFDGGFDEVIYGFLKI